MAKKRWIQKTVERMEEKGTKGAFREYCQRLGYEKVNQECINRAKKSNNPTLRKRAVFAENMLKINKNKRR